jgi:hypothetical protein
MPSPGISWRRLGRAPRGRLHPADISATAMTASQPTITSAATAPDPGLLLERIGAHRNSLLCDINDSRIRPTGPVMVNTSLII